MTDSTITPSRRAALGVLASIPALVIPAGAMSAATAGGPSPDADIFALAERCEAAAKRFNLTCDAYTVAEFSEPHDQAAEDEAERRQGVASDELDNAALPLILARATTFAGLLAKARALKCAFPGEDCQIALEDALRNDEIFDPAPASLSLARDLIALAGEHAA
jgi:hypothetical protein